MPLILSVKLTPVRTGLLYHIITRTTNPYAKVSLVFFGPWPVGRTPGPHFFLKSLTERTNGNNFRYRLKIKTDNS